tara:strand:+ start:713 stop:1084 length:372 start_codon:yes stop_codon:yes gene_type:complete
MTGYKDMLKDLGLTQDQLNFITNNGVVLEFTSDIYYKKQSNIHGEGVFSKKNILKGDIIGLGSVDNKCKTILGRYVNHSDDNNAKFYYLPNKDLLMLAEKNIIKNTEILVNYRHHTLENERIV